EEVEEIEEEKKEEVKKKVEVKRKIKQEEEWEMETEAPASLANPEMNSRIFLNKIFIVTSAESMMGGVVFKKEEMKKKIRERGGVVLELELEHFNSSRSLHPYSTQSRSLLTVPLDADVYLIANKYCRTYKYIAAIARGIPCISHNWVIECMHRGEITPYDDHKLPAGMVDGVIYPLPDVKDKLFEGLTMLIHSRLDSHLERGTVGFTKIVNTLESAGKVVVSSVWLMESIITGSCLDFSHHRFRYDLGNGPVKKEEDQPTAAS
ncbi:hypothetical protein PMAYCL1PPCAC_24864, partial [Pristionchus mayeri]